MYHLTSRGVRHASGLSAGGLPRIAYRLPTTRRLQLCRPFHNTMLRNALKPYLLADIGEGITECQITAWLVKPGDQVQQFDPICEVQSDKASVEITSRFDGTICKLHYEVDEMAAVGTALLDIEIDDADVPTQEAVGSENADAHLDNSKETTEIPADDDVAQREGSINLETQPPEPVEEATNVPKNSGLVTPAVRHMLKDLNIDISDVQGTGKGQRVLKEDVLRHAESLSYPPASPQEPDGKTTVAIAQDRVVPLTRVQSQMFQSMTKSLQIPHFLYTNIVKTTNLSRIRRQFSEASQLSSDNPAEKSIGKLSALPFILKALSQAATEYPIINSSLDTSSDPNKPSLILKTAHNIGIAIDTPKGLVVPVIRNVQDHSIISLAAEIKRLGKSAREGKLSTGDMAGVTLVVSNIGSIGGHIVSPIILDPTVMILGIGKSQYVPVFETDEAGNERIAKEEQMVLSWSADHRVLDGATVARCAQRLAYWLENPAMLGLNLR